MTDKNNDNCVVDSFAPHFIFDYDIPRCLCNAFICFNCVHIVHGDILLFWPKYCFTRTSISTGENSRVCDYNQR